MAATRVLAEFTYQSGVSPNLYYFTVVYDQNGRISVRNIQSPYGLLIDSMTELPQSVTDDICTATAQVEDLMAATSAINGTLTFVGEAEKSVTFATALSSTGYRVHLSTDTFVPLRITNKTVTGFTVQAGATFSGTVGYDVFI